MSPELPWPAAPVYMFSPPLRPAGAPGVNRLMLPLAPDKLVPDDTDTSAPGIWCPLLAPATSVIGAPKSVSESPPMMCTPPAGPPDASPLPMTTSPVRPDVESPVRSVTLPVVLEPAVDSAMLPLAPLSLAPLASSIEPPPAV